MPKKQTTLKVGDTVRFRTGARALKCLRDFNIPAANAKAVLGRCAEVAKVNVRDDYTSVDLDITGGVDGAPHNGWEYPVNVFEK
jgi:hypothetical protein